MNKRFYRMVASKSALHRESDTSLDVTGYVRTLIVMVLLLSLPFLLFWQVWWPDPAQRMAFEPGDFTDQHVPMRRLAVRQWRAGRMPLWDPYTYGGQPLAASGLFQVFYPLGAWQLLFSELPQKALELEALVHLGLAGIFTFLLAERLTGSWQAGLVAGLTFSWSGLLTSWPLLQFWVVETMIWLPAALWLLETGLRRRAWPWILGAAVVYSCSILAGHGQTVLYSAYLSAAYLLWRGRALDLPWTFVLKVGAVIAVLTLALTAFQWLPTVEHVRLSARADWGYADRAQGFRVEELRYLVQPRPGAWSPLYVGWVPLALAAASPWLGRKKGDVLFWLGVVAVALLLSLGGNGFLYPLFYRIAPGFAVFRHQERIAYLVALGLAVLAGYSFAGLRARWPLPKWVLPLVLLLIGGDLYRANNGVILAPAASAPTFGPTPASTYLAVHVAAPDRVSSESHLPGDGNAGMVYQLRDVTGNNPVQLGGYQLTLEIVPEVRWWQLLNVDYVLTERTFDFPGITEAHAFPGTDLRVHALDLGQRPVWITHDVELMPNQEAAIYFTSDVGKVDPLRTAVLETAPDPAPQPARGEELAEITTFAPQRIEADVTLSAPGVVVFSEIAYPGWIVHVNGERVSSLRAFGLLRAVALPAGDHEIVWRFRPVSVYVGATLTILTILGLGGAFIVRQKRSQRSVHELN